MEDMQFHLKMMPWGTTKTYINRIAGAPIALSEWHPLKIRNNWQLTPSVHPSTMQINVLQPSPNSTCWPRTETHDISLQCRENRNKIILEIILIDHLAKKNSEKDHGDFVFPATDQPGPLKYALSQRIKCHH